MSSAKIIKAKTKSIKNIQKMTEALEKVAVAKLTRALIDFKSAEAYSFSLIQFLVDIMQYFEQVNRRLDHPFIRHTNSQKSLVVCITSRRGLCGGYNSNIWKAARRLVASFTEQDYEYYVFGKKGVRFAEFSHLPVYKSCVDFEEALLFEHAYAFADELASLFVGGGYGSIYAVYMGYSPHGGQHAVAEKLLPFDVKRFEERKPVGLHDLYIFEPNSKEVLRELFPEILRAYCFSVFMQTQVSEHFARNVAMKKAYNSAKELSDKLLLEYNRIRQNKITNEIIEIMGTSNIQ